MTSGFAVFISLYLAGFIKHGKNQPILLADLDPLVWGLVVSLVVGVIVARTTAPPPDRLIRKFFAR